MIKYNYDAKENRVQFLLYFNSAYIYAINIQNIENIKDTNEKDKYIDYIEKIAKKKYSYLEKKLNIDNYKYNEFKIKMIEIFNKLELDSKIVEDNDKLLFDYKEEESS